MTARPTPGARAGRARVHDAAAREELRPVLGRPGAVVADGEDVGTWRPRASGRRLRLQVTDRGPWDAGLDRAVDEQAEHPGALRGVEHAGRAA